MKYFKTQTAKDTGGYSKSYEISDDSFNEHATRFPPFYWKIGDEKYSAYAICPSCENPIQLIGLFNDGSKIDPYGKHAGKTIPGLPEWNYGRYITCPYANPDVRIKPSREEEFFTVDDRIIAIYELLKKEFDTVTYFLEAKLQIKLSTKVWESALTRFVGSGAYGYKWLNEANLPYIFAYWGIHQQEIYNQYFIPGTDLYKALEKQPEVAFVEVKTGNEELDQRMRKYRKLTKAGERFVDLSIGLYGHKYIANKGEELHESMQFCIVDSKNQEIYKEKINFDQTHFQNLIRKDKTERAGRPELLKFAKEHMPQLTKG